MKTLLTLTIGLLIASATLAFDTPRVYQEHEQGWIFTFYGEVGTLTHHLCDVEIALKCAPMDCGPYCYNCKNDQDQTMVVTSRSGDTATLSGDVVASEVTLYFKDLTDPAITVHN